jgi:hypothetical protein
MIVLLLVRVHPEIASFVPRQNLPFWKDACSLFLIDEFVKSHFMNDFEHFGGKALMMFSVKNANCLRALARVLAF